MKTIERLEYLSLYAASVIGVAAVRSWYHRRIMARALSAFSEVEKLASSAIIGRFGGRRFRIDVYMAAKMRLFKPDDSWMSIKIASGATLPFKALRGQVLPFSPLESGPVTYESGRPERLEQMLHSSGIKPLVETLMSTAATVEACETVSVRFAPFKKKYLEATMLTSIFSNMLSLANALDQDAVRAGAEVEDVDRHRHWAEEGLGG